MYGRATGGDVNEEIVVGNGTARLLHTIIRVTLFECTLLPLTRMLAGPIVIFPLLRAESI